MAARYSATGTPKARSTYGSCFTEGADEATFRRLIVASLRQGRPVLAFGVAGPPECCIITGYDEGGDVLIGWSFLQDDPGSSEGLEFEPSGYFRKRDWFRETPGIVVLGEKRAVPPRAEICRATLEWGLSIMRTPLVQGTWANGLAAYDAWIACPAAR